jgi:hypothetical protein
MRTLKQIEERLEVERAFKDSLAKLTDESLSGVERELELERYHALMARKLELAGPPVDEPGTSEGEVEAACARAERWRAAHTTYCLERERLGRERSRIVADPNASPGEKEAAERALASLREPDFNALPQE